MFAISQYTGFGAAALQHGTATPPNTPNLSGWWDFSDQSSLVISGGTEITTASDKSGNNFNSTKVGAGTTTNGPLLGTFNGLPAADFFAGGAAVRRNLGGSGVLMGTAPQGISVLIAAKGTQTIGVFSGMFAAREPVGQSNNQSIISGRDATGTETNGYIRFAVMRNESGTGSVLGTVTGIATPDNGHLYAMGGNSTQTGAGTATVTATARYDGGQQSSVASYMSGTIIPSFFGIGNLGDLILAPWPGLIGEVRVFSSKLSQGQFEAEEGYLAWKWGLHSNLPSDHPYKTAPP